MPRVEQESFSPKEVAARLGISVDSVRRLVKAGQLRAMRVGRVLRIRESAIEQFMEEAEE